MAETTKHTVLDGKAQLYKRKQSSNWWCRFSYDGEQYKHSLKTSILKDAKKQAETEYLETISRLKYGLTKNPIRFNEAAKSYLDARRAHVVNKGGSLKNFEEKLVARTNTYFKPYLNDKLINKITEDDVQGYYGWRNNYWTTGPGKNKLTYSYKRGGKKVTTNTRRNAPRLETINTELGVLKAVLDHAVKKKWLDQHELPEFNRPTAKYNRRPCFEPSEVQRIFDQLFQDIAEATTPQTRLEAAAFQCIVEIAALTGMRPIEFEKLKWHMVVARKDDQLFPFKDIKSWTMGEYNVRLRGVEGKTDPRYLVPARSVASQFSMLWDIWEDLTGKHPGPNDPVLFNLDTLKPRGWPRSKFGKLLKATGLMFDASNKKRSPYSLRHYAITEWLKQGIPWQDVAKNAGTSVKMLKEHYDHVSVEYHAERFEMMVELNKMDDNKELAKAASRTTIPRPAPTHSPQAATKVATAKAVMPKLPVR